MKSGVSDIVRKEALFLFAPRNSAANHVDDAEEVIEQGGYMNTKATATIVIVIKLLNFIIYCFNCCVV